jgi:lycopene beta-cyclase
MSHAQPLPGPPHVVLVGGGLANGLIAYRLKSTRPDVKVTVLERGDRLGGNHTWSFHETDVDRAAFDWLQPFIVHSWSGQSVRFAERLREFSTRYCSISSERFHDVLAGVLGDGARLGTPVRRVLPRRVELEDGTVVAADAVIDGRGGVPRSRLQLGWQKFVGLEVDLDRPHGLSLPIIMDATVDQSDGYRFIYVLPLASDRLLIEDTRYTEGPSLDVRDYCEEVLAYAATKGWSVTGVSRSETGALPITLGGDIDGLCRDMSSVARSGLAAGLFHPTTGYSLPDAARLADRIAAAPALDARSVPALVQDHARELWRRRRVYRLLNRMLFHAAAPAERHQVLSHFYRLPQALVERFYGDRLTMFDKFRILSGRPPVPIPRAVRALLRKPHLAPSMAGQAP